MRVLLLMLAMLGGVPQALAQTASGPSHVEFDDRLVKGQRRGTNSVYIFERQHVEMRSMVKKPHSFRHRILLSVFEG